MYADIRDWVSYNPDSGLVKWIKSPNNNAKVGDEAGGIDGGGYIAFHLHGRRWPAHRAAWVISQGSNVPAGFEIDHIYGNKQNNKLDNLRLVTRSENSQNRKVARKDSKTGLLGVTKHKRSGLFNAYIRLDGKSKSLGYFKDPQKAYEAYVAFKRTFHIANTL